MADFAERLPLTEGTNRVIADEAGPSFLASAADFASDALEGTAQFLKEESQRKQAKKAAEEKASKAALAFEATGVASEALQDVAASRRLNANGQAAIADASNKAGSLLGAMADENAGADPLEDQLSVFYTPPAEVTPAMEREFTDSAARAASVVAAVNQGRMPEISVAAAVTARFRALREKYPEHSEYLLDIWKKAGLDGSTSPEIAEAEQARAFEIAQQQETVDAARKREEEAIDAARLLHGPAAINMSREALIVDGMEQMRIGNELSIRTAQLNAQLANKNLTDTQREGAQEDHNRYVMQQITGQVYNQSGPEIKVIMGLVDAINADPNNQANIQSFLERGQKLQMLIPRIAEHSLMEARRAGFTGDETKFRESIVGMYKPMLDAFTGDASVVSNNLKTLSFIETKVKLSTTEALPFFFALQKAGLKPDAMPGFLKAVDGNPELQQKLANEVRGFAQEWGQERGSTHLMNAIKIMRGEATLAEYDPASARDMIKTLTRATGGMAKDYVAGKDVDPNMVISGVGNVTLMVRSLQPGSGLAPTSQATLEFANATVRAGLIKALADPNADKPMVLATIQASRAASAKLSNNLQVLSASVNKTSPYFKAVFDPANGRWRLDKSAYEAALRNARSRVGGLRGAGAGLETGNAEYTRLLRMKDAPSTVRAVIAAGNNNLDNAIELGKYDPSTPNASELELRNWYGIGRPLKNQVQAAPINPTQEMDKALDRMDDILDKKIDVVTRPVDLPAKPGSGDERRERSKRGTEIVVPAIADMESKNADNPIYGAFKTSAAKYGIPQDVALRLGWVEGKFKAQGTNSVGASGPAQVRGFDPQKGPVHDTESLKVYGKLVRDLTPEENVDFGMKILKREYEKSGDWRTAVKRYLGAEKGDANLTGEQYANLIF